MDSLCKFEGGFNYLVNISLVRFTIRGITFISSFFFYFGIGWWPTFWFFQYLDNILSPGSKSEASSARGPFDSLIFYYDFTQYDFLLQE